MLLSNLALSHCNVIGMKRAPWFAADVFIHGKLDS